MHIFLRQSFDSTMTPANFWDIYKTNFEKRLQKTTLKQKEYVMNNKMLDYFGNISNNKIAASMIRGWQGEMMEKGFKSIYLKTIHN